MTDKELDQARVDEAVRLSYERHPLGECEYTERGEHIARTAIELERAGWKPVDPLMVKAREIVAAANLEKVNAEGLPTSYFAQQVLLGERDSHIEMRIALAALRSCQ